jgi:hypothetical protein
LSWLFGNRHDLEFRLARLLGYPPDTVVPLGSAWLATHPTWWCLARLVVGSPHDLVVVGCPPDSVVPFVSASWKPTRLGVPFGSVTWLSTRLGGGLLPTRHGGSVFGSVSWLPTRLGGVVWSVPLLGQSNRWWTAHPAWWLAAHPTRWFRCASLVGCPPDLVVAGCPPDPLVPFGSVSLLPTRLGGVVWSVPLVAQSVSRFR